MGWQGIRDNLQSIAADRQRGAHELVRAAARALRDGLHDTRAPRQAATELARTVLELQPDMAPFHHLAAALLPRGQDPASLRERLDHFLDRLEADAAIRAAAQRVPAGGTVATYSRSSSVVAALRWARSEGREFGVWISEGRPGYEGRSVAAELVAAGLTVELMTDAALFGRAVGCGLVLVGADAVGAMSFRNKVGTAALCRAARAGGVPAFVVAHETKLLPESRWPQASERPAAEVWEDPPDGVRVCNPYFEAVPVALTDGVFVDDVPLTADALGERVEGVSEALAPLEGA